jgi:hypothetical protein
MTLRLSEIRLSKLGRLVDILVRISLRIWPALRVPAGAKAVIRQDFRHYLPDGPPASLFL